MATLSGIQMKRRQEYEPIHVEGSYYRFELSNSCSFWIGLVGQKGEVGSATSWLRGWSSVGLAKTMRLRW